MTANQEEAALTAREAACVTGVPLKRVHRIIDSELLDGCVSIRKGTRAVLQSSLVALKIAHETAEALTLDARRKLARHILDNPHSKIAPTGVVNVDLHPARIAVRQGIASLRQAKRMILADKRIMGGMPCFRGTRIPVHLIAGLLANGDDAKEILEHYPSLTNAQVDAAPLYAAAYPMRQRRRRQPWWRKNKPNSRHTYGHGKSGELIGVSGR